MGAPSDRLWQRIEGIYDAILAHPFLTGLADGTLPQASFTEYLVQDGLYLRSYAATLAALAARASTTADTDLFAAHAVNAVAVERALHADLLGELGADATAAAPSPTCTAYTSYLAAAVHRGSFAEGLAAVLPCYWIYARVGRHLQAAGSPDPRYQRWIDSYGAEEFQSVVDAVLAVTDRVGDAVAPAEAAAMTDRFVTASRYEWMFWDAAFRRETWPV
jgi:thiaminase/transcriptional activator TenA